MSQISTHILDTTRGRPAEGVTIILSSQEPTGWQELARGRTNHDGRLPDLLPPGHTLPAGVYQLRFLVQEYFDKLETPSFYPFVEIVFSVTSAEHYHVPLLLNPFGYSTYRGS